ncbi:hypothetical protein [Maribacter sp.]|uniref:hypothetical protein n=1 Tax=Maribacter sp. TaxID=1897614 RepID=UPI0032998093
MKNIFKKKQELSQDQKAKTFWSWFKINQNNYLFLSDVDEEEKENLLNIFIEELQKFNEHLYFEIGGHPDDEKVELIISAEGNTDVFPAVEDLTTVAPSFKNWDIIAFKPPMGKGFELEFHGIKFNPETIIYVPLHSKTNPNSIGINVYYPDFIESEKEVYLTGTFLMLDTILGEKSSALDIDYVDILKTPEDITEYNFGHLSDIAEFVKEKKNS